MESIPRRPRTNKTRFKPAEANHPPFSLIVDTPSAGGSPLFQPTRCIVECDRHSSNTFPPKLPEIHTPNNLIEEVSPNPDSNIRATSSTPHSKSPLGDDQPKDDNVVHTTGRLARFAAFILGRTVSGAGSSTGTLQDGADTTNTDSADPGNFQDEKWRLLLDNRDQRGLIQELCKYTRDAMALDFQVATFLAAVKREQPEATWNSKITAQITDVEVKLAIVRNKIRETESAELLAVANEYWDEAFRLQEDKQVLKGQEAALKSQANHCRALVISTYLAAEEAVRDPDGVAILSSLSTQIFMLETLTECVRLADPSDSLSPVSANTLDLKLQEIQQQLAELSQESDEGSDATNTTIDTLTAAKDEIINLEGHVSSLDKEIDSLAQQLAAKRHSAVSIRSTLKEKREQYDDIHARYLSSQESKARNLSVKQDKQRALEQRYQELEYMKNLTNFSRPDFIAHLEEATELLKGTRDLVLQVPDMPEGMKCGLIEEADFLCVESLRPESTALGEKLDPIKVSAKSCRELIQQLRESGSSDIEELANSELKLALQIIQLESDLQERLRSNEAEKVEANFELERLRTELQSSQNSMISLNNKKNEAVQARHYVDAKTFSEEIGTQKMEIAQLESQIETASTQIAQLTAIHSDLERIEIPTNSADHFVDFAFKMAIEINKIFRQNLLNKLNIDLTSLIAKQTERCRIRSIEQIIENLKSEAAALQRSLSVASEDPGES